MMDKWNDSITLALGYAIRPPGRRKRKGIWTFLFKAIDDPTTPYLDVFP
jgi:hypothetical protein